MQPTWHAVPPYLSLSSLNPNLAILQHKPAFSGGCTGMVLRLQHSADVVLQLAVEEPVALGAEHAVLLIIPAQ